MSGASAKSSRASPISMFNSSATFFPFQRTSSVSLANRAPPHCSQVTQTSARKSMSSRVEPLPSQASHRPPATLKLKRPAFQPRFFASGSIVNSLRMSSHTFT